MYCFLILLCSRFSLSRGQIMSCLLGKRWEKQNRCKCHSHPQHCQYYILTKISRLHLSLINMTLMKLSGLMRHKVHLIISVSPKRTILLASALSPRLIPLMAVHSWSPDSASTLLWPPQGIPICNSWSKQSRTSLALYLKVCFPLLQCFLKALSRKQWLCHLHPKYNQV